MTARDSITPTTQILDDAGRDWAWAFAIFREVPGHPGYCVGTNQTVWTRHQTGRGARCGFRPEWRQRTFGKNAYGYHVGYFRAGTKPRLMFLHRLMLLAFRGPCPEGMEGCHNNGVRDDNRLENIRWDTRLANVRDMHDHDTHCRGERNRHAVLTADDVRAIRRRIAAGDRARALAGVFGVSEGTIYDVVLGRSWSHIVDVPSLAAMPKRGTKKRRAS